MRVRIGGQQLERWTTVRGCVRFREGTTHVWGLLIYGLAQTLCYYVHTAIFRRLDMEGEREREVWKLGGVGSVQIK